jgi:nucleoside-diphosphate-sugar epimerase
MRILVTGANGYIGRHCLGKLRSSGNEVHATTTHSGAPFAAEVDWHCCDLLNQQAAACLMRDIRPTHLLHLAWIATPGVFWNSPLNEAWNSASRQLANCFVECGGQRMVVAGSCAEYPAVGGVCAEADHDPNPATPYAQQKLALREYLMQLAENSRMSLAWARLFWSYGPFEHPARLVPSIIRSLLRDEPAVCSAGLQRRDYLHVDDVATALVSILVASVEGSINVGSGTAPSIASIATQIAELMDKPHLLRMGGLAGTTAEAPLVVADVRRLQDEIGFRPRIDLTSGLGATIRWWTERAEREAVEQSDGETVAGACSA